MKQHFFRKKAEQIAEWSGAHKKRAVILYSTTALVLIAAIVTAVVFRSKSQSDSAANTVYREETATEGALTVGITEEGSVTIGTTTQTLDVDISAYTGSDNTHSGFPHIPYSFFRSGWKKSLLPEILP